MTSRGTNSILNEVVKDLRYKGQACSKFSCGQIFRVSYGNMTHILHLDPYQKAAGEETVLHWACQSRTKKEILLKLLTFKSDG